MLKDIKGIGPKILSELNKLNIFDIEDILTYYPYRYNYYKPQNIKEIKENETAVITGVIENNPKVSFIKRNLNRISFNLNTGTEIINIIIFNRAFLKNNLSVGKTITVIGKYKINNNTFTASDLKLKPILKPEIDPVYHLGTGIKKANFIKIINLVLEKNIYLPNYVPDYLNQKYKFIDKLSAVKAIHNPNTTKDLKDALLFLKYEEMFTFMLKINYLKLKRSYLNNFEQKIFNEQKLNTLIYNLPFTLTNDQLKALDDIKEDLLTNKRMNRLLLGDVGSGKTIVALLALYMNALAGYQGVLMAPTEILANQHYNNTIKISKDNKIALLTSSTKAKERKEIIQDLKDKKIDILIGTHSVLNDEVSFNNLGLVITDEQHRFGVKQRQYLQQKGKEVDVLYMSATPIPRTLALTIYGDMDISFIKEKPKNNKEVITRLIKDHEIKEGLSKIVEEIKLNHQIYVIVPLVEENEELNMENVTSIYDKLNSAFHDKIPMDIMYGKLNSKEKDRIMKDFKENKTKILISTTVIEVGIDVSNATMIVIFNAERFGLATLHQLRGRVGRSDIQSYCYLISNQDTERLRVMEETTDGFEISEKDFKIRGTGDLFGVKQSGDMTFKLADLKNDYRILLQTKEDSEEFLKKHLENINLYPYQQKIISSIKFID